MNVSKTFTHIIILMQKNLREKIQEGIGKRDGVASRHPPKDYTELVL